MVSILVDTDSMQATWQSRSILLSPLHVRMLMALGSGRRTPRRAVMAALEIDSLPIMNRQITALRMRFATAHIPLRLHTAPDGYELQTEIKFTDSEPKERDAVGMRIIKALIRTCADDVIADMARRHFLEP